jgi:hypothetical protein
MVPQNSPIVIVCEDPIIHTPENNYHCTDFECPCWLSENDVAEPVRTAEPDFWFSEHLEVMRYVLENERQFCAHGAYTSLCPQCSPWR